MKGMLNKVRAIFQKAIVLVCLLLLSAVFVSGFSSSTSPFFTDMGADSAIFRLIGYAMKNGKALYVDIFDHKGPVLFFIEYIGQMIQDGRYGIFLVQIAFLFVTLVLIYLIARIFIRRNLAWIFPVIYLATLSFVCDGGNLTEEYSAPLCFLAIYLIIKNTIEVARKYKYAELVVSGAMVGLIAFIRLNNAVSIVGFIAVFILSQLMKKGFKESFRCTVAVALGFLTVCLVVMGLFAIQGSLGEMIYASFTFNFKYSEFSINAIPTLINNGYFGFASLGLAIGIVGAGMYCRMKKDIWIPLALLFSAILSMLAVMMSTNGYHHYLQLILVPLVIGLVLAVASMKEKTLKYGKYVLIFAAALSGLFIIYGAINQINNNSCGINPNVAEVQELVGLIPVSDRNQILGYNLPAALYLAADILPEYKYFTLQDWWASHDLNIYVKLRQHFMDMPPKWLIINGMPVADIKLSDIIKDRYYTVHKNGGLKLLRLSY